MTSLYSIIWRRVVPPLTALALALALLLFAPAGVLAVAIPESANRGGSSSRILTKVFGDFVVWEPSDATAWIQCPTTDRYGDPVRLQPPQRVADTSSLQVITLPGSAEAGVVRVIQLDSIANGLALGRLTRCNGSEAWGRVDLATGAFTDHATLPQAVPADWTNAEHRTLHVVDGEVLFVDRRVISSDWRRETNRLTRIDLRSGRVESRTVSRHVFGPNDKPTRSRNGDLVWIWSDPISQPRLGNLCGRRAVLWRWPQGGAISTSFPKRRARQMASGALGRAASSCWGSVDVDGPAELRQPRSIFAPTSLDPCVYSRRNHMGICDAFDGGANAPRRCCTWVVDDRTSEYRVLAPVRSGPWQRVIGVTDTALVWEWTERPSSYRDDTIGAIQVTPFKLLMPSLEFQSVRRDGRQVTIRYRTRNVRWKVTLVRQRTRVLPETNTPNGMICGSWGEYGLDGVGSYCTHDRLYGTRRNGSCTGPHAFEPNYDWSRRTDRCHPNQGPLGTFVFDDLPGRQVYRLDAAGMTSREIIL